MSTAREHAAPVGVSPTLLLQGAVPSGRREDITQRQPRVRIGAGTALGWNQPYCCCASKCHHLMGRCPHVSSPLGDDPGQQGALCLPALPQHSSLRSRGAAGVLPSVSPRIWPRGQVSAAGSCDSNWSLTAVSKICTQCEMEHKADGMMEQMCSSDFGECWGPVPSPPGQGSVSPRSDSWGGSWPEGEVVWGQPHGRPLSHSLGPFMHGMGAPQKTLVGDRQNGTFGRVAGGLCWTPPQQPLSPPHTVTSRKTQPRDGLHPVLHRCLA